MSSILGPLTFFMRPHTPTFSITHLRARVRRRLILLFHMSPPTGPKKVLLPQDPYSLLEAAVIRDASQRIKAIKHHPSFASAIVRLADEVKGNPPIVAARRVGAADLVCFLLLFFLPYLLPSSQLFVDHSDFERIADQAIIYDALVSIQELIDRSLVQHHPTVKNWCVFADSVLKIIKDRRSAQAARERADVRPLLLFFLLL